MFFTVACFALITMAASAQSRIPLIVKAGMNMSSFTGSDADNYKARIGYRAGLGTEFGLTGDFFIQPSLMFSAKGAQWKDYDVHTNALYVELPVMAAYKFRLLNDFSIVLSAGPYFAYGVGGKIAGDDIKKMEDALRLVGLTLDTDTFGDNGFDRFDMGIGVGAGVEIGRILLGLDVQYGLIKLKENTNVTNVSFSIGAGYRF